MTRLRMLPLVLGPALCLVGQITLPDPAQLASIELSDSTSIIVDWDPYRLNHLITKNILLLPEVYKTIRFADVNGDGYPDLCFVDGGLQRYPSPNSPAAVLKCALGSRVPGGLDIQFGTPTVWDSDFGTSGYPAPNFWGPDFFNDGIDIIQFADINGDGRADVCAIQSSYNIEHSGYLWCKISSGVGFSGSTWIAFTGDDASRTLRFVDLNHDGKADVCVRAPNGINCALSNGSGLGPLTLWSPDFSDANGWNADPAYWSTIQFGDLNGDGLPDVCGRGPAGMVCAVNQGHAFTIAWLWTNQFSDANGWNQPQYYSTIRLVDINGDGKVDVCGRGIAGYYCAQSGGVFFGYPWTVQLPEFSDANGWNQEAAYKSLWWVDLNNDGKADLCGRGHAGIWCALSTSTYNPSFAPAQLWVGNFGDNNGWNTHDYYWGTVQPLQYRSLQTPLPYGAMTGFCGRGIAGIWCSSWFFKRTL